MASIRDALRGLEFWENHIELPEELASFISTKIPVVEKTISELGQKFQEQNIDFTFASVVFSTDPITLEVIDENPELSAKRQLRKICGEILDECNKYIRDKEQNEKVREKYQEFIEKTKSTPLSQLPGLLKEFCRSLNQIPLFPKNALEL